MKAMGMLKSAGEAKNVGGMRKALTEMSTALGNGLNDCGVTGKCAAGIREARASVDTLNKDLGMTPMNEGTLKKDGQRFMMAMKGMM